MLQYRGIDVLFCESPAMSVGGTDEEPAYRVTNGNGLVYSASCQYGIVFADNGVDAASYIRDLIDSSLEPS